MFLLLLIGTSFETDIIRRERNLDAKRLWEVKKEGGLEDICKEKGFSEPKELYNWMLKTFGWKKIHAIHFKNAKKFKNFDCVQHKRGAVQWYYYDM